MKDLTPDTGTFKKLIGRFADSKVAKTLSKIPPISWLTRTVSYYLAKSHIGKTRPETQFLTSSMGLQDALDRIVKDVVEILGYTSAMVSTYESGDVSLVRAFYVNPEIASVDQVLQWEEAVSKFSQEPVSLMNPSSVHVYIHQQRYSNNLGVRAAISQKPEKSNNLFDIFTPIAPEASREVMRGVQLALGVQEVIAIPFFLEVAENNYIEREYIGNLFAAKNDFITSKDEEVLSTFAQYLASFILSERRRSQAEIIQNLILEIQKGLTNEDEVLTCIVKGVVSELGYVGAMVALYEENDKSLPAKALYVDPSVATLDKIHEWEKQLSEYSLESVSITDPNIAKVYIDQEICRQNLSIKAALEQESVVSDELFDLFTPVVPEIAKEAVKGIQQALGIQKVIAVPFYLETGSDRGNIKEYVGNLFAITQSYKISNWEKKILNAFGQQAAAGLRNVKLYQRIQELYKETEELYNKAENRRKAAEIFGKMAFTASASVHALNNYMSVIKGTLQILKSEENESLITPALKTADNVVSLIENFHEPGKLQKDTLVDVNACIGRAAERTLGINIPWIRLTLSSKLMVKTIPEMLTEAFKVLIENANQAMSNESVPEEKRLLEIESKLVEEMVVVTVEDHGAGLEPENLSKIFEIRFTTKESGLGFGLFWTKDYIEGLGGSIFVESVIGMGTKFTISLPAATRESL